MYQTVPMTLEELPEWLKSPINRDNPFSGREKTLLWKGLFLCMRQADVPSIQLEVIERLASLLHCFDYKNSICFYSVFLNIMCTEWDHIDVRKSHRYVVLLRRVSRECFVVLRNSTWNKKLIEKLNEHVKKTISNPSTSIKFLALFIKIYLEELTKMSAEPISKSTVTSLMEPFRIIIVNRHQHEDYKIVGHTIKYMFDVILHQIESGREYLKKFEEWESNTFPSSLVPVQEIHFDHENIIKKMEHFIREPSTKVQFRCAIRKLIDSYSSFVQEKIDSEPGSNHHLAANKRKKTRVDVQPKKLKLVEVEQLKPNNINTHLALGEIPINMNNSCKELLNDKENAITVSDIWHPVLREDDNKSTSSTSTSLSAANAKKRVRIVLENNRSQYPWEYLQQLQSSPNIPYDSAKKPGKGLLKSNIRL